MCQYRLTVDASNYHPGGTALRVETFTPTDRCALKPKKDNAGRKHDPWRWVMSGGSPITVAHPCSGNCPLKVPADIGNYGASWAAPCPICRTFNKRSGAGTVKCRECGTEFELVCT